MKKEIFTYLKSYSFNPEKINRLVVSAFLYSHNILTIKNRKIKDLLITAACEEFKVLSDFLQIQKISTFEELIEVFEFVISPQEKIVTGAIYTPNYIRKFILDNTLLNNLNNIEVTICDPACGCAAFLFNAAKKIRNQTNKTYFDIFKTNIFGLDIQEYSIRRSEILLSLLSILEGEDREVFEFNLFKGNALNFTWEENIQNFKGFDIVVGNPPYVCSRNIDEETKGYLKLWDVCKSGHPDLYIPFFEIGLKVLKPNGYLGFITMNTFFKSLNGRALRDYFRKEKNKFKLIDFGGHQVFQSKATYTCICLINKKPSEFIEFSKSDSPENLVTSKTKFKQIPYETLDSVNGWNLQEVEILNKIESVGTPLGEKFKTRNGIATLKNDVYIFNLTKQDNEYFYLENEEMYPIEKEICRDIINPNRLINVDSIDLIMKKIIFPYENVGKKQVLIEEKKLKEKFPKAYYYLKTKKNILSKRDKGKGNYENWYAYGRNQSMEKLKYKLFFPHLSNKTPNFVSSNDENLLFYNGLALISDNEEDLVIMKKILSSRIFWFYIINSSKPYGSGYFSLSRNYIKRFGICDLSMEEKEKLLNEHIKEKIDDFLDSKYGVNTSNIEFYRN